MYLCKGQLNKKDGFINHFRGFLNTTKKKKMLHLFRVPVNLTKFTTLYWKRGEGVGEQVEFKRKFL